MIAMKKFYAQPMMEIVEINFADIIATSGTGGSGEDVPPEL